MLTHGRVLVIAGSDSSGGAGLEADQKTIAAHGCYAMTATTALTVQDTKGVYDVHHTPPSFVGAQLDVAVKDIGVDVVKIGMLASASTAELVAEKLVANEIKTIVLDPVMVSTSGAQLFPDEAIDVLRTKLLPCTVVLTPNLPEAKLLLAGQSQSTIQIEEVSDLENMARAVQSLGPQWVLLKGGHVPFRSDLRVAKSDDEKTLVVDILCSQDQVILIQSEYQSTANTHGTGCTLASAIASNLARGMDVPDSVQAACRYVQAAIKTAPGLGHGHGPLNHFHSTQKLPFAPNYFVEYLLARSDVSRVWQAYTRHPFVMAIGAGTLPIESFQKYLCQDYTYLLHFARTTGLAVHKSKNFKDIARSNEIISFILSEVEMMHVKYCESFGVSIEEMQRREEHPASIAYSRYMLDIGASEDWLGLQMALSPCMLGYVTAAKMLVSHPQTRRDGNIYWPWIKNYAEDCEESIKKHSELLEEHMQVQSPHRIEELVSIFIQTTKMEIGFWDMFPAI